METKRIKHLKDQIDDGNEKNKIFYSNLKEFHGMWIETLDNSLKNKITENAN